MGDSLTKPVRRGLPVFCKIGSPTIQ
jgi:hypothetical protein